MESKKEPVNLRMHFNDLAIIPTDKDELNEFCELWDHLDFKQIMLYTVAAKRGWISDSRYALDWLREVELGINLRIDESILWYDDFGREFYRDFLDNEVFVIAQDGDHEEALKTYFQKLEKFIDFEKIGKQKFDDRLNVFDPEIEGMITLSKPPAALEREWNS